MIRKINILFILDVLWDSGGTENHLYYLVKYLNRERFNCFIVTFDLKEILVKIRKEDIKVYHIPVARFYTPNAIRRAFELKRIIKEERIDIVQTFHFVSDTYGVMVSKLSGIKHIISSRRDIGDKKKKMHILLNKIMNRQIDKFVTVCEVVGKRIEADEGISKSKMVTIYNGVQLDKFTVRSKDQIMGFKRKVGIAKEDFVIGMVAHFRPEKNYDIFLKAGKTAKKSIRNLKIFAIGEGPMLTQCQEYCRKNDMYDYVTFTGRVDDVRNYIAVMDIACLVPGSNEGFSNAILEKMAMGKPLIVTDVGGNAEAVLDGVNGMVIAPFDHAKLAEAMIFLYKNASIREEMGKKSRSRIEKLFSMEKMIIKYENLYQQICNS